MSKFKYDVYFTSDTHIDFTTEVDMNFHDLKNTAIAYDELYINMANVTFIKKKKCVCGNCAWNINGFCEHPRCELVEKCEPNEAACDVWKERK